MLLSFKRGATSVLLRCKILDSAVTTGAGKTGLTNASAGLIISTIADNEATATAYTVAGSNVETVTTLGTYSAPTGGKCRFREVDATNHPGVYELQFADARFAVANSKSILVSISGASGAAQCDFLVPLWQLDPYDAVRAGLTALPNANAGANGGLPTGDATGAVKVQSNVKKNQALSSFMFMMTDSTTHAPVTGKTVSVTRSIDGGAFGSGTLSAVTEVGNGYYKVDFAAADLNGNVIVLRATAATSDDTFVVLVTSP
jgi:hypothetical protein